MSAGPVQLMYLVYKEKMFINKNFSHQNTKKISVEMALSHLRNGGVVAIPTETVYGLAADITQPKAIENIFITKQRPFFDPLIVHISEVSQLKNVVDQEILSATTGSRLIDGVALPPLVEKLASAFWPGPLTMILPKHKKLNSMITSGLNTVAVRMPKHPLALQLIHELEQPVAAPSANRFGRTSPTRAEHVFNEFSESVPVLDGGPCEIGVESTVIAFNPSFTEIHIYRPGAITHIMLQKFAPTETVTTPTKTSPGQLEHHYMPDIPLVVLSSVHHLSIYTYEHICTKLNLEFLHPCWLHLSESDTLAARELYARLRESAQQAHANCILLARKIHTNAVAAKLEYAIADRLSKAATLII